MTITGSVGSSRRIASSNSSPVIRGMTTSVMTKEGRISGTRSSAALPSDAVSTWYPHSSSSERRPSSASGSSSATRMRPPGRMSGCGPYASSLSACPMIFLAASPVPAGLVFLRHPPAPGLVVERLRRGAENDGGPGLVVVHRLEGAQNELALPLLESGAEWQKYGVPLLAALCRGDAQREEDGGDELLVAADDRSLDDVAKLAHVAGPRVVAQAHHRGLIHPLDLPAVLVVELGDEGLDEDRDVLSPLAQRWQRNGQHVDPVVEILAERLVPHRLRGIAVGRRDDPHVDLDLRLAADPADHAILQDAEILHLERGTHLRDLIEEDGAAVGQLEEARLALVRAREGALLVTEELALHQRLGNGRAVDGDERSLAAHRHLMNGPGDQLLARSRLSGDEHRRVAGSRQLDQPIHLLHRRARTQDGPEAAALPELPAQESYLSLDLTPLYGLVEQHPEAPWIHRLGQVVIGALAHGGDGRLYRRVTGQKDDYRIRVHFVERLHERDAIQGRHHQISDDDRGAEGRSLLECILAIDGLLDFVAPTCQQVRQSGAGGFVIIGDQNAVFHGSLPRSLGLRPWLDPERPGTIIAMPVPLES